MRRPKEPLELLQEQVAETAERHREAANKAVDRLVYSIREKRQSRFRWATRGMNI